MGLPWVCQLAVEQDWRWVVLLGYFHGVMQHSPLHGSAGSSLLKPGASRINREVPLGCSENTVEGGWFLTAARLLPPSTPIASSIPGPCFHTSSPAAEDLSTAHHVSLMLGGANRLRRALLRGSKRAVKMEKIIGERERERERAAGSTHAWLQAFVPAHGHWESWGCTGSAPHVAWRNAGENREWKAGKT